jgi:7-carboxy-7-deazaguanine synthase
MNLKVSEIFYSLQGEGARQGEPSIFIRLQGCSAKFACYASGVKCDTEFESGEEIGIHHLIARIDKLSNKCEWIVWTGGEPTDQLTEEIISYFKQAGYKQAIETSGLNPVPKGIDFISISPKVAEHILLKNFIEPVGELRYVRHSGQSVPNPSLKAQHYFLSPHFDGTNYNQDAIKHCINLCLENPSWKLSIQIHKLLNVL